MLVFLLTNTTKIWLMCILAHLSGFLIGLTIMFYFYDRWAFKRFKENDNQWKKIVSDYQRQLGDLAETRKDTEIDIK